MKKIAFLMIISALLLGQTAENRTQPEPLNKKLYGKGAFIFGPGFERIKVGEKSFIDSDKENEDIEVMPGGGFGIEGAFGYDLTKSFSIEISIGMQNSGEVVNDDKLTFNKTLFRASALYKIQTDKKYAPYFGAGLSMVISARYTEETGVGDGEIVYNKPTGFHVLGGAEWKTPDSPLFFYGEARFLILGEFEYEDTDIPVSIIQDFGMDKMSANGIQFSFGIGYYIN